MLDAFGMSDRLRVAREALPITKMIDDAQIIRNLQKRLKKSDSNNTDVIRAKIEHEVSLMYADLCIFGCESDAYSLSNLEPFEIYKHLRLMNEIKTYPILFGLESQPNYNFDKLSTVKGIQSSEQFNPLPVPKNELEILFSGIGINIDNVSVEEIIKYHTDGLGKQLRGALVSFNKHCNKILKHKEKVDEITIYERAELFQKLLKNAIGDLTPNKFSKIDRTYNNITRMFRIGSVAVGAALPFAIDPTNPLFYTISLGGSGVTIALSVPDKLAEFITKLEVRGFQSKFVANMWTAKRIVGGKH